MGASLFQAGDYANYTPTVDTPAGSVIDLGAGFIGVVANDIFANQLGSAALGGVHKLKNSGIALAVGVMCGYSIATDDIVATGTGDFDIGRVFYAAASTDADVYVLLNDRSLS